MKFSINEEECQWAQAPTLEEVLAIRNLLDRSGLAVAVNEEVISRHSWKDYRIQDNDKVLVITATSGG